MLSSLNQKNQMSIGSGRMFFDLKPHPEEPIRGSPSTLVEYRWMIHVTPSMSLRPLGMGI
jgi:hypothetical protein